MEPKRCKHGTLELNECFECVPYDFCSKFDWVRNKLEASPELVRYAVNRVKALAVLRVPNYELPADSFIEEAVKDILRVSEAEMYKNHYIED